ncbi:MAG: Gfo/Idh/MocA family oxidoreductase, partial [Eubacterium sp.]
GFAKVPHINIVVYYPKDGVSTVQEKQMLTQEGDNTYVVGVSGNFDDTQNGVKEILNNSEIDAVMICSSTDTHSSISIDAAKAGKHIF